MKIRNRKNKKQVLEIVKMGLTKMVKTLGIVTAGVFLASLYIPMNESLSNHLFFSSAVIGLGCLCVLAILNPGEKKTEKGAA